MAAFAAVGTAGFLAAREPRMAGAFLTGAALSILGYRWLERGVAAALDASRSRVPRAFAAKLMLRYPLLIAALFLSYETHWLPSEGVLLGFFVPVAGAIVESLTLLGKLIFVPRPVR
jgi:ATP synthase I chain